MYVEICVQVCEICTCFFPLNNTCATIAEKNTHVHWNILLKTNNNTSFLICSTDVVYYCIEECSLVMFLRNHQFLQKGEVGQCYFCCWRKEISSCEQMATLTHIIYLMRSTYFNHWYFSKVPSWLVRMVRRNFRSTAAHESASFPILVDHQARTHARTRARI